MGTYVQDMIIENTLPNKNNIHAKVKSVIYVCSLVVTSSSKPEKYSGLVRWDLIMNFFCLPNLYVTMMCKQQGQVNGQYIQF